MKEPNKIDGNRRDLLKGLGIAAVVSLLPETGNAAQNNAAPKAAWDIPFTGEIPDTLPEGYNILLITCDQERYFERYPFPVPGRERLMKTGITFTNHQNTANVCTPSRSVMYTGLHMPHTRMFDNLGFPWMNYDLDPELRTVGHMMRELGYYTAYKGKWHLTREIDQPVAGKSVEEMDLGEIPTPRLHEIMEKYGFSDYHGIGDVIGKSKGGYFFDSVTTGQTISWLRNTGRPLNDENKPWFAAVNLVNPHDVMYIDTRDFGDYMKKHIHNFEVIPFFAIVFNAEAHTNPDLIQQHATGQCADRDGAVPDHHVHRQRNIGALACRIGQSGLQQGGGTAEGQPPNKNPCIYDSHRLREETEQQRNRSKCRQASHDCLAQMPVYQSPGQPDSQQRRQSEDQQHNIDLIGKARRCHERRDIGVEHVVRQHPGQYHGKHGAHSRCQQHLSQADTLRSRLPWVIRHLEHYPGHQHQGQGRHQAKCRTPPYQRTQPGAQWHTQ